MQLAHQSSDVRERVVAHDPGGGTGWHVALDELKDLPSGLVDPEESWRTNESGPFEMSQ
ncbi:MAG: hypothetical protein WBW04_19435 [Nitrolancea sp.]